MKERILELLSIEKNEEAQVKILLLQSVFFGIFNGLFDISAHTIFLDAYAPSVLPTAYLVSGVVGILITAVYSRMQASLKFAKVSFINLLSISILTIFLRLSYSFFSSETVSFAALVMFGPLKIVGLVGFWGTVVRLFTLRQGKRLFGMIDAGQVLGVIISSYSVPVLISHFIEVKDLLWICSASIIAALLIQGIMLKRYELADEEDITEEKPPEEDNKDVSFRSLLKDRYILIMSLFIVLSTAAAFFVQFSFLAVTKGKYPDGNDLGKFLGWFNGTLMIFSILIKTFVYSKLLKTYGLRVSLVISPVLLTIFTAGAVFLGSTFGVTPESKGFLLFFLVIALSRLFSVTLKESFEAPSFKVLYQSLENRIRYVVQASIDGTVNEFAALFSGILLVVLGFFSFIDLLHYSYVLLFITISWIVVSLATYNNYQISLRKSMEIFQKYHTGFKKNIKNRSLVNKKKVSSDSLQQIEVLAPGKYRELLVENAKSGNEEIKRILIEKQKKEILFYPWQRGLTEETRKYVEKLFTLEFKEIATAADMFDSYEKVQEIIRSGESRDRILAARIIEKRRDKKYNGLLIQLIRDINDSVKKAAIEASPYVDPSEFSLFCLELLGTKKFNAYAYDALVRMGEPIIDTLEQTFFKSNTDIRVLVRTTLIMGEIGGVKAQKYLLNKLVNNHIEIIRKAVYSLNKVDYDVEEKDKPKVIQAIKEQVGITIWNMIADKVISEYQTSEELKEAMQKELNTNNDLIFKLLAVIYDKTAILQIRENLDSGTSEGIGFGIELLDLFIDDELKPILFPLFEDSPIEEKMKKLEAYYPIRVLEEGEIFKALLNRGYNALSHWVKIWVLKYIYEQTEFNVTDDLIAQLFNKDLLIRQLAASVIYHKDRKKYEECIKRIPEANRNLLNKFVQLAETDNNKEYLRLVQIRKYGYFTGFNEKEVLEFVRISEYIDKNSIHEIKENSGINPVYFFFLAEGSLTVESKKEKRIINKESLIDGCIFENEDLTLHFDEDTLIYRLPKEDFLDILFESTRNREISEKQLFSNLVSSIAG